MILLQHHPSRAIQCLCCYKFSILFKIYIPVSTLSSGIYSKYIIFLQSFFFIRILTSCYYYCFLPIPPAIYFLQGMNWNVHLFNLKNNIIKHQHHLPQLILMYIIYTPEKGNLYFPYIICNAVFFIENSFSKIYIKKMM